MMRVACPDVIRPEQVCPVLAAIDTKNFVTAHYNGSSVAMSARQSTIMQRAIGWEGCLTGLEIQYNK